MTCYLAQTVTLVFAIINLTLVIGSNVCLLGLLIYYSANAFLFNTPSTSVEITMVLVSKIAVVLVCMFVSLVNLLFSSFLMNGILKKKPDHIKVYYIFGILKTILSLFSLLVVFCAGVGLPSYSCIYYIVLVCYFIYAIILHTLRYTYLQFETKNNQFNHVRLDEKC